MGTKIQDKTVSGRGKLGIAAPCFSASNAAKLADTAEDIQRVLATKCSKVTMTNHFTEKRFIA